MTVPSESSTRSPPVFVIPWQRPRYSPFGSSTQTSCPVSYTHLDSGQASVSVQSVSPNSPATDTKLDWKAQKEEQARLRKRQNDLKKVEAEIHDLETRDGEIDALLCDESVFTDVARLMELNKEKEDLAAKLEVLYEKWEELAE